MRAWTISLVVAVTGSALAVGLAACPPSGAPRPIPPSPGPAPGYEPPPAPVPPVAIDAGVAAGAPAGAPCLAADECASHVCEGQGCGADQPGTCAEAQRICTAVMATWCGCDGATFTTTSGCAGRRYAARGACPAGGGGDGEQAGRIPDGSPCLAGSECASGTCEGAGCGDDQPGTCAPARRACTRDLRPYCGCDGVTFRTSGSCPGRRYARRGAC